MRFIWIFILLFAGMLFAQSYTYDTEWLYKRGNDWKDSVSVLATTPGGLKTFQVASDTLQDTLTTNAYTVDKEDIGNMWVDGAVNNDSTATGAPDTMNTVLEMGLFSGTGGYPDSTGILWKPLITVTQDTVYRISLVDSTWFIQFNPQKVYLRWRETTAQRNKYVTTLHEKRGK